MVGEGVTLRRGNILAQLLDRARPHRGPIVWLASLVALHLAIILAFAASPEVALQYWYLLSAPIILSAFRFGMRGALASAIASMLILVLLFRAAGHNFEQASIFAERFVRASLSPLEARDLALQLADLRANDPQTSFGRGLTGLGLVIFGGILLGSAIDTRNRAYWMLERAFNQLRRYFSPQIIQTIIERQREGNAAHISSTRKEITVMFADVRGFTDLAERLEPEETAALLNEFFTAMTDEIFLHDGTLDKYLGDGIMAFFGDPVPYPDHTLRAFKAALGMQQRMRELRALWEAQGRETFGIGIGIGTGHAIVGNTGSPNRMDYTVMGSTVNVASRLADLARAGEILTTHKTFWRVQNLLDGVALGPAEVKGLAEPIAIVGIRSARLTPSNPEAPVDERLTAIISHVVNDPVFRSLLLRSPAQAAAVDRLSDEELRMAQQVAALTGYPIFRGIPASEIAAVLAASEMREHPEGALVVRQGSPGNEFFIVLRGDVVVNVLDENVREHHVDSLATGDYFGEVSLLYDTPRTANVRAASDCTLLTLDREGFYTVLRQATRFRTAVEETAARRAAQPMPVWEAHDPGSLPLIQERPVAVAV